MNRLLDMTVIAYISHVPQNDVSFVLPYRLAELPFDAPHNFSLIPLVQLKLLSGPGCL